MNKNYLIEIPKRERGVYIIFNIVEHTAYVGIAENMISRANDHFRAICNNRIWEDNKNLIKEDNKQFLHLEIEKVEDKDVDLKSLESLYLVIIRDEFKFKLYNIQKCNIALGKIDEKYKDQYHEKTESLRKCFKQKTGKKLDEIVQVKEREKKEEIWKSIIVYFSEKNHHYCLENVNGDFNKCEEYEKVCRKMNSLILSRDRLKKLEINWTDKSIKSEDLRLERLSIISNFGSHNGEVPYEILKKMDLDLKNSDDGCAYWALSNVNEVNFREEIKNLYDDNEPVYVIFKTTTSDSSGGERISESEKGSWKIEKEILEKDKEKKNDNFLDLMHSYKDEKEEWKALPNGLTYVTIQTGAEDQSTGKKCVAFKIKKFYMCKEYFDTRDISKKSIDGKKTRQGTYKVKITKEKLNSLDCAEGIDSIECFIAELQYPYVVEISNAPGLELYLQGKFKVKGKIKTDEGEKTVLEEQIKPRIVFETEGSGKRGRIRRAYSFYDGKAYVWDVESELGDVSKDEDEKLHDQIKEYGEECSYEIALDDKTEIIKIFRNNGECNICLDRNSNLKPKNAMAHDDYKYYRIQDINGKTIYSFRYYKKDIKYPVFVFDEMPKDKKLSGS